MKEPTLSLFSWQGSRVGVMPRSKLTDQFEGERFSTDSALALLRAVQRDQVAMVVMRLAVREDLIGENVSGAAGEMKAKQIADRLSRINDADVVDHIRQGVTMGRLVIVREKRSWRTVPKDVAVVESPPPAAAQAAERVVNQPPASTKKCCCTNPACAQAFDDAAANGTPMVERGGPSC